MVTGFKPGPAAMGLRYNRGPTRDDRFSSNAICGKVCSRMKLLLIDGHYYVYRSFFAIQNLSNSRGEPTNAIFGFTKTLRLMMKHLQPELGAVVWDEGLPQKRVALQPAYKETRKEMPRPMVPQLDFIQNRLTPLLGLFSGRPIGADWRFQVHDKCY
mgnify:CR=1 FL=1